MSAEETPATEAPVLSGLRRGEGPGGHPAGRVDLHGDLPGVQGDRSGLTCGELLAGAAGPHGEHENPRQGWDSWARIRHAEVYGLDAGADTYGRHALSATDDPERRGDHGAQRELGLPRREHLDLTGSAT